MNRYRTSFRLIFVPLGFLIGVLFMSGSVAAEIDGYMGVAFHPFTLDGENSTCVPWMDEDIGQTSNCDPINLIFPGQTWEEVRDIILTKGWSTGGGGSSQWLHYAGTGPYIMNEQLFKQSNLFSPRYHIRLWQPPTEISPTPVTFAAVHHESWLHTIDMDWEQAEAEVAAELCGLNCGQTGQLAEQYRIQGYDNTWRPIDVDTLVNDASATVIPAPSSPDLPSTVSIVEPAANSPVSGTVIVQIEASDSEDPAGSLSVEWNIDGDPWKPTTYSSGYYVASWVSTAVGDGPHFINARATDSAANVTLTSNNVIVDNANDPPLANFDSPTCIDLACDFNASASSDSDGSIVDYAWDFGDGTGGNGVNVSHTYAAGTYTVELTVTDDDDATGSTSQNVVVHDDAPPATHVGDLDGIVNVKKSWQAQVTITVHNAGEGLVDGATVSGSWNGDVLSGQGNCTTDGSGTCTVISGSMSKKDTSSAIFAVSDITYLALPYNAAANHDPQGNSSGTAIQVNKDGTTQDPGVLPNQPPVATFTYGCDVVSLACSFDATGSSDPDGNITEYTWDFGDGNSGSDSTVDHPYLAVGSYLVTLTVTDDATATAQDQQNVYVGPLSGDFTLIASGSKVKGAYQADLTWSGAPSLNLNVIRDGTLIIAVTHGETSYTDNIGRKVNDSYDYQLCVPETSNCSNVVTVTF